MIGGEPLCRLRRQRNARAVHRLGDRALFEFLDELARHHPDVADDLDRRLAAYAKINPLVLRAVRGDQFAPAPLRVVGGRR